MKYNEYKNKIDELLKKNLLLWQQTHIMFIPITNKMVVENPTGEETRVRYDISNVWDEFVYKENKVLFFINKYLNNMLNGINVNIGLMDKVDIWFPTNNIIEEAIYYFDALVSSFGTLIEPEQKDILCKYLDSKEINEVFPTRKDIGLYWQIYMLRNRIMHFTNGKYDYSKKECIRFHDFSSKITTIHIDNKGELHANSTLIDINKCEQVKIAINMAINNRDINPFEILFPNQSAKGYGKGKPFLSFISNDIFFDHIDSSVMLIDEILEILCTINKAFLKQFIVESNEKEKILNSKIIIVFNDREMEYSINDVFNNVNTFKEENK